jgi:arylsulfatase A
MEIDGKRVDFTDGQYGPAVATDFICDFIRRKRNDPFLVYYPMILTHCPFEPTPDSADWDPKSKGSKTYKGDPRYFGDMVAYMDKMIGQIVATLEESGVRKRTLILFTGDNGTDAPIVSAMGQRQIKAGKGAMTDNGTRVPLIANWPGTISPGRVSQDLVDFTDFLPTMCAAADVAVPAQLAIDGRSFLAELEGQPKTPRPWIYCWYSRGGNAKGAKIFARNQRYKLFADGSYLDMTDGYAPKLLDPQSLSDEATRTQERLQAVLDRYKDARPPHLMTAGKTKAHKNKRNPKNK